MNGRKPIFLLSFDLASCVTLIGVALSLGSIAFAASGRIAAMALCAIWAGVCDFLDGPVARAFPARGSARPKFGAHLDSVADMASFGVAPVAVAWLCGNRTPLDAAIAVAYVVCVAQRLAYFGAEETPADGPRRFYSGLPVTFGSLVFALAYPVLPLFGGAAFAWTLRGAVVLLAALYVLNFPMPKPRGLFYPVFILLALAISAFWVLRMIG